MSMISIIMIIWNTVTLTLGFHIRGRALFSWHWPGISKLCSSGGKYNHLPKMYSARNVFQFFYRFESMPERGILLSIVPQLHVRMPVWIHRKKLRNMYSYVANTYVCFHNNYVYTYVRSRIWRWGSFGSQWFLHLFATAMESTSCQYPASPQRKCTFLETKNSLYSTVYEMPIRLLYVTSVNTLYTATNTTTNRILICIDRLWPELFDLPWPFKVKVIIPLCDSLLIGQRRPSDTKRTRRCSTSVVRRNHENTTPHNHQSTVTTTVDGRWQANSFLRKLKAF